MTKDSPNSNLPKKRRWKILASSSAWLCSVVAVFVFPPPQNVSSDPSRVFVGFAAFLVAILVGLLAILASKFNKRRNTKVWLVVCMFTLVIGTASMFLYENQRERYTGTYEGQRVVIGSEFTVEGKSSAEPGITVDQLIMDGAGQPSQIWTAESIQRNAFRLRATYLVTVITLAGAIVAILQALECSSKPR